MINPDEIKAATNSLTGADASGRKGDKTVHRAIQPDEILDMICRGHFGSPNSLPSCLNEWPQVVPAIRAVLRELQASRAIIAKLLKTADGVLITDGMPLYSGNRWKAVTVAVLDEGGRFDKEVCWDVNLLYATRESRAVALATKGGQ